MRCWNSRPYAASAIGGTTSTRVTRVEVDPPIADAEYGREFQQRMMAYRFYPAHTRDGRSVANVVTIPIRIGH